MNFCPGDHIESHCTRCHDITGHVIIALVDGAIVKVVCQACGSIHKYYPPKKASTSKRISSVSKEKSSSRASSSKGTSSRSLSIANAKKQKMLDEAAAVWQKAMNTCVGTPKAYTMNSTFGVGDIIDHTTFGKGIVQSILYPDKVQILFREGVKLLKCIL